MELVIKQYDTDGKHVIDISGEITVLNIDPFRETVAGTVTAGKDTVFDMRDVRYIDSAGIEQLVYAYKMLKAEGHGLTVLVRPGSQPENVFEAVALQTFAGLTTDPAQAGLGEG